MLDTTEFDITTVTSNDLKRWAELALDASRLSHKESDKVLYAGIANILIRGVFWLEDRGRITLKNTKKALQTFMRNQLTKYQGRHKEDPFHDSYMHCPRYDLPAEGNHTDGCYRAGDHSVRRAFGRTVTIHSSHVLQQVDDEQRESVDWKVIYNARDQEASE